MKTIFYISMLLPWLLLGCTTTDTDVPGRNESGAEGLEPFVFSFSFDDGFEVSNEEKTLNDLTVLQFASDADDAECVTSRYLYAPVPDGGTINSYSIGLRPAAEGGYVILIANAGPVFRSYEENKTTLAMFKQETLELDQKTANSQNVLMIGDANVATASVDPTVPADLAEPSDTPIEISLKRLVARIRFTWQFTPTVTNTTFEPLSLKIKNVPKQLRYVEGILQTEGVYPDAISDNFKDYTSIVDGIDNGFTWYIPMNRRGRGNYTVTNIWEKTGDKAPDAYCTYIELSGVFRTPNMSDQLAVYRFYVGGDNKATDGVLDFSDYSVEANCDYDVNATIVGVNTFDKRVEKRNFVFSETANCFMVAPENDAEVSFSPYKSPGTDVVGSGVVYKDQVIEDRYSKIADVRLIWQTSKDLVTVSYGQGMINAIPNNKGISGNALIGAYDEADHILWSWHIWVTPYAGIVNDNEVNVLVGKLQSYNNQTWMDRNLGALNTLTAAVPELMYQWGRKDPFLKDKMYLVGGSSFSFSTNTIPLDPIISSVKSPTVFYIRSNEGSWYGDAGQVAGLWQDNIKTVFDPCPYGWRVPQNGSWNGFEQNVNFFTWNMDKYSSYDVTFEEKAIFRLGGCLLYSNGTLNSLKAIGHLWSSTVSSGTGKAYSLYYESKSTSGNQSNGVVEPSKSENQAYGFSVRCVKLK